MSKQYLTTHTLDTAHPTDIFSLAATSNHLISSSGASTLKIYSTQTTPPSLIQTIPGAHPLGCHHVCTSLDGTVFASAGFGGEVKIWSLASSAESQESEWELKQSFTPAAGEAWAISLSSDGKFLALTTFDGRIIVYAVGKPSGSIDGEENGDSGRPLQIQQYETKGSFGLCVDISNCGRFTASGHENGAIYVFNNDTGRMLHSLPGLVKPVRTLSFSPASTILAAAGDSATISLFSISHLDTPSSSQQSSQQSQSSQKSSHHVGEQIATLRPSSTTSTSSSPILSLSFSPATGAYLLTGSYDGKVRILDIETRQCVSTHSETGDVLWSVRWLPSIKNPGGGSLRAAERFVTAGGAGSITFYREASGG